VNGSLEEWIEPVWPEVADERARVALV
jgi:hypothetical protein